MRYLRLAALTVFLAAPALAEVWQCDTLYTTNPPAKSSCKPIRSARICGSDGNKYFGPVKTGGVRETGNESCPVTKVSANPFAYPQPEPAAKPAALEIFNAPKEGHKEKKAKRPCKSPGLDLGGIDPLSVAKLVTQMMQGAAEGLEDD